MESESWATPEKDLKSHPDDPTTVHARLALGGSAEDQDWLVRRFEGCLLWQARYRLGRVSEGVLQPEDLVQETWAAVFRRFDTLRSMLDDERRVTPRLVQYLSTTLRRLYKDHCLREVRRRGAVKRRELGHLGVQHRQFPQRQIEQALVALNLASRHPAWVKRDDLVVEARQAALALPDQLRVEAGVKT